jgi:hypothetical protein
MMTIRKRFSRSAMPAVLVAASLVAAGCGDDSSGGEKEAAATPQEAVVEIAKVRAGLAASLNAYAQGNTEKAEQLVGDLYLEHFEPVEALLGERDEELNEELEELISTEIRQEMKKGTNARVNALAEEAVLKLSSAEKALGR